MNEYLENFYNLFSLNDKVVYSAVLAKKDWLFKKLYVICSFKEEVENNKTIYPEIFGLMDQSLVFEELKDMSNDIFIDHEDKKELIIESFNDKFRYKYFYEVPRKLNQGEFLVEMDFNKIDKETYNSLVANFYPCISEIKDLDFFYDEKSIFDLLKYPMYGEDKKWMLIIGREKTFNNKFYLPLFKRIVYNPSLLNDEMVLTLKEIASNINISLGEDNGI